MMLDRLGHPESADRVPDVIVTNGDFGEELRRRRTASGLTLRSLAEQIAFDFSYLAQVERGARTGSAVLARKCDNALDADGQLVRLFVGRKLQQLMWVGRNDA